MGNKSDTPLTNAGSSRSGILLSALLFFLLSGCESSTLNAGADNPALGATFGQPLQVINSPPAGQIYHAVYPGGKTGEEDDITLDDLRSYEQTVGKQAAWVYFSNNWYRERRFPRDTASWIRENGSVPFIRLMLRDGPEQNQQNLIFTLQQILQGTFDADLHTWARDARDFGSPLIVEYGTEVNGEWFPWNGAWNGGSESTGYGDPAYPDGPERFRDAYRHIIDAMRQEGASNITWVFHVNHNDVPESSWNRFENYYPGDGYVDWIGVSVYGAQTPLETEWPEFRPLMDEVYPRLVSLAGGKPIVLLEFGVTAGNRFGDQAAWAESALADLTQLRWPKIIGFSWWNEAWENDNNPAHNTTMRVQDNAALAAVFRMLVGSNDKVLSRLIISSRTAP